MEELTDAEQERLTLYKTFIGRFVTVIKKDGFTVAGILMDITSDNYFYVKGKHKECVFHFKQVEDITARPDRSFGGDQHH